MADWKQITARIRRARGSRDPGGQLALLYEKTNDAMVAFELGRHFEISKEPAKSLDWYLIAAQRFRRGDWKNKARDAVVRLGGELPPDTEPVADGGAANGSTEPLELPAGSVAGTAFGSGEPQANTEETVSDVSSEVADEGPAETGAASADKKRRRRGRRGGRNRRKGAAESPRTAAAHSHDARRSSKPSGERATADPTEILPPRVVDSRAIPRIPVEPIPEAGAATVKGRFGDPGLSSRLSLLEMQLRRLLTCPPAKLEDGGHAPAGPGVFVLTDDEMTTYYYVESCDTLRIALSSLSRTGMTRRGNTNLKSLLAENLGIPEGRAAKYMTDHCVVRWLQLDEGATNFHHFAIAVLRPILNE